jgi:nucleotide-binding universal stress UspA family protein
MFKKIMILVDENPSAQSAIQTGIGAAKVHGASLIYLYVPPAYACPMVDMQGGGMAAFAAHTAEQFEQQVQNTASTLLKAAEGAAHAVGVDCASSMAPGDASVDFVVEATVAHGCDLMVVAAPGSNAVVRLLTGNLIPGLISRSHIPVMICPAAA